LLEIGTRAPRGKIRSTALPLHKSREAAIVDALDNGEKFNASGITKRQPFLLF